MVWWKMVHAGQLFNNSTFTFWKDILFHSGMTIGGKEKSKKPQKCVQICQVHPNSVSCSDIRYKVQVSLFSFDVKHLPPQKHRNHLWQRDSVPPLVPVHRKFPGHKLFHDATIQQTQTHDIWTNIMSEMQKDLLSTKHTRSIIFLSFFSKFNHVWGYHHMSLWSHLHLPESFQPSNPNT